MRRKECWHSVLAGEEDQKEATPAPEDSHLPSGIGTMKKHCQSLGRQFWFVLKPPTLYQSHSRALLKSNYLEPRDSAFYVKESSITSHERDLYCSNGMLLLENMTDGIKMSFAHIFTPHCNDTNIVPKYQELNTYWLQIHSINDIIYNRDMSKSIDSMAHSLGCHILIMEVAISWTHRIQRAPTSKSSYLDCDLSWVRNKMYKKKYKR